MLTKFREKHPQYKDMCDEDLICALHKKFYSDMPMEDFRAKMTVEKEPIEEPPEEPAVEVEIETEQEPEPIDYTPAIIQAADSIEQMGRDVSKAINAIKTPKIDTTTIANAVKMVALAIPEKPDMEPVINALNEIADTNRAIAEAIKPQPVKPWTFTVNRDHYGSITNIVAEPH